VNYVEDHEAKKAKVRAEGRGYILDAHTHTLGHRLELEASQTVGCFYCCEVYSPSEIEDWVDNDDCALCPRCGIDSVIGEASGFPVADKKFLKEMNEFWF
jgi:hypothetical protein